jgi:hypothetical protein
MWRSVFKNDQAGLYTSGVFGNLAKPPGTIGDFLGLQFGNNGLTDTLTITLVGTLLNPVFFISDLDMASSTVTIPSGWSERTNHPDSTWCGDKLLTTLACDQCGSRGAFAAVLYAGVYGPGTTFQFQFDYTNSGTFSSDGVGFGITAGPLSEFFAHVTVGGGFENVFTFTNTEGETVTGTLFLTDKAGDPMSASFRVAESVEEASAGRERRSTQGSSLPLAIEPGGTRIVTTTPLNSTDPLATGWARFDSTAYTMGGVGTFQYSQGDVLTTICGVLASRPVKSATIPVNNDESMNRYTGFAVANPQDANITLRLVTVKGDGSVPGDDPNLTIPLGPYEQTAIFLHQLIPARLNFKGSMILIAQGGYSFVVVALVQDQGLYTAIPVKAGKDPTIP